VSYLLDTNVVSEVRRRDGEPRVVRWLSSVASDELFVSVLVLGEVRRGIDRLRPRDPDQAAVFERWLAELYERFSDRVLPIDATIADEWGRMTASSTVPVEDGLMAATAKVRGLTFVTRNVAHVARTGARLLNPWDPAD